MMKTVKLAFSLLFLFSMVSFTIIENQVFICKGPSSKVYHKSDRCRGLSNCSTEISKVTIESAKKLGRRACKIEY
jgi:hypothetical protein